MEKFTEGAEVLAYLSPLAANAAVGAHNTDYVCMSDCHRAFVLINIGEVAATATLNVTVYEASDEDGSDAQELDDKALTQLTVADEDGIAGIEINSTELEYEFIQVRVTVGTDTFYFAVTLFGFDLRYQPADVSGFTEITD